MEIKRTGDVVIELSAEEANAIRRQLNGLDFIQRDKPELWKLWAALE